MAESKTNPLSEESIGHAPYYRTTSPLGDQIEQARLSTKHMPKVLVMGSHDSLHVPAPGEGKATPAIFVDVNGQPVNVKGVSLRPLRVQPVDVEYRLDHVLKENLGIVPLDHGNSHDRSMLTDMYGGKGIVGVVIPDEAMPVTLEGVPADIVHPLVKLQLQDYAAKSADALLALFPHEVVQEMAVNKHAPATEIYEFINGKLQGASADYVERAIGEQYGTSVLNKIKAARAAE